MSQRPGFIVNVERKADGGKPPNQYVARTNVQIRVHYPPLASQSEVLEAMADAFYQAVDKIMGPLPDLPTNQVLEEPQFEQIKRM